MSTVWKSISGLVGNFLDLTGGDKLKNSTSFESNLEINLTSDLDEQNAMNDVIGDVIGQNVEFDFSDGDVEQNVEEEFIDEIVEQKELLVDDVVEEKEQKKPIAKYNLTKDIAEQNKPTVKCNKVDSKTGHCDCLYKGKEGRNKKSQLIKGWCPHYTKKGKQCLTPLTQLQSCNSTMCHSGRVKFCHVVGWDHHLSDCVNSYCDENDIKLSERLKINQFNIEVMTGFPSDKKYNHISKKRRETNGNEKEKKKKKVTTPKVVNNKTIKKTTPTKVITNKIVKQTRPVRKEAIKTTNRNRKLILEKENTDSSSFEERSDDNTEYSSESSFIESESKKQLFNKESTEETIDESYDKDVLSESSDDSSENSDETHESDEESGDLCEKSESIEEKHEENKNKTSCKRKLNFDEYINEQPFKKPRTVSFNDHEKLKKISYNTMGTCYTDSSSDEENDYDY